MEGGGGGGGRGGLCSGRVSFARSRSLPGAAGGAREGQPVRLEALARSASGSGRAERATTKEKGDAPAVTVVRRAARGERHGEGAQSSSAQAHGGGRSEGTRRGGDGARRGVSPLDLDDDSSQEGATGTGRTRERCQTALKWLRAYSGPASRERGARWWIDESKGERRARACRASLSPKLDHRAQLVLCSLEFSYTASLQAQPLFCGRARRGQSRGSATARRQGRATATHLHLAQRAHDLDRVRRARRLCTTKSESAESERRGEREARARETGTHSGPPGSRCA